MTPQELKDYVDAALRDRDHWTLLYFCAVPVIVAVSAYLMSYLTEKGKTTATKEDIGHITTQIESSKAAFSEQLEKLRVDLASRSHYSKVRYEREMKVFEDVWPKLCGLREAVRCLRPVMDTALQAGETEETRKKSRAIRVGEAYQALATTVEHNRPFYSAGVWKQLWTLLSLCWGETVDYRFTEQSDNWREYWEKAMKNTDSINEQVDKVCEAIRSRLTAFDEAQGVSE